MFRSDYKAVEKEVSDQAGSYQGIEAEALLTSEEDFRRIFAALPDIKVWAELGSGHGLGPLLFAHLFPQKKSLGIEFEKPRFDISVQLKNEHHLTNVDFILGDMLTCDIPQADTYFLYFPTGMVLDRVLHELGSRNEMFQLVAIESHGDLLERLKKESWLKASMEIPLSSPRHCDVARVFTKISQKQNDLHDFSFLKKYLLIEDENSQWLGESLGLEWLKADEFKLLVPPRSFKESQVKEVLELADVDKCFQPALLLRGLGELRIVTETAELQGHLRKIYVAPCFKVEISSGEQVEWGKIRRIFWESTLCFDSSLDYFFYPHVV